MIQPLGTRPRRFAAIDVGTNSIREIVMELAADGQLRLIDDEKINARIGEGLGPDGSLAPAATDRAVEAIRRLKEIADAYRIQGLEAVATAAVRGAPNRDAFVRRVERETGLRLRVIAPEEEARLSFRSLAHNFDLGRAAVLGLEVGGGSAELVSAVGSVVDGVHCIPAGALLLTQAAGSASALGAKELDSLRRRVRKIVAAAVPQGLGAHATLYASGGTITTLAAMAQARRDESFSGVQGCVVKRREVKEMLAEVAPLGVKERRAVPGLSGDRVDIIVAGLALVLETMKRVGAKRLCVSEKGIREGLVLEMVERASPARRPRARHRLESVKRLARLCDPDRRHTRHVTGLALSLYDQMFGEESGGPRAKSEASGDRERDILEAAGALHDVGRFIGYRKHHKHAYHLIVHSDLAGYSPREIELIANVARYHRRAEPSRKQANFAALDGAAQRTVRRLAALLRFADGLDRSHRQKVESLRVEKRGRRIRVFASVSAGAEADLEVWGGRRNVRPLEKVLGVEVSLVVERTGRADAAASSRPRGVSVPG